MPNYHVKQMKQEDIQIAINWAEQEGWEPGIHDASLFYLADNKGFFKGVLKNEIIATGSAVIYDDQFAFFGLYILKPDYRGMGYGLQLTQHRHAYCGDRNKGLDGVLDKIDIYSRLGFIPCHKNTRYLLTSTIATAPHEGIVPLSTLPFEMIKQFDRQHFPAARNAFLKAWISQENGLGLGYIENGHLRGYGVIRQCQNAYKIGPLFAEEEKIADTIFLSLADFAKGARVFLDIPENNSSAMRLVERYQMDQVFATIRMYTKEKPQLKDKQIYGITSFELG